MTNAGKQIPRDSVALATMERHLTECWRNAKDERVTINETLADRTRSKRRDLETLAAARDEPEHALANRTPWDLQDERDGSGYPLPSHYIDDIIDRYKDPEVAELRLRAQGVNESVINRLRAREEKEDNPSNRLGHGSCPARIQA